MKRNHQCEECPLRQSCTINLGWLATLQTYMECEQALLDTYTGLLVDIAGVPAHVESGVNIPALQSAIESLRAAKELMDERDGTPNS